MFLIISIATAVNDGNGIGRLDPCLVFMIQHCDYYHNVVS